MIAVENQLLAEFFRTYPEKSIQELEKLSDEEIWETVHDLPVTLVSDIVNRLKTLRAGILLTRLEDRTFSEVYDRLDPVRAAHLLLASPAHDREEKITLLSPSEQKSLRELQSYPEDSAGALMDTELRTYRPGDKVHELIENLRNSKSTSRDIFITDIDGKLIGFLPVQELLFADDDISVENIMHRAPPSVNSLAPKSDVTETFETYKTTVLPVTHIDGVLLGAIRYASLVSEMQNKAISTMATMGGASPSERALSPPLFSVSKRLPWLMINLLTAFIASAVVGFFEDTIAKVTALAVLLPVVAGQSGNTGAQAMAVTMRGLALREVRTKQWLVILFKELRVGLLNGIAVAIVTGGSVYFWSGSFPLGLVMTAAMIFSMIIASLSGAAIPMMLTSMGRDPAASSSVILTTVTDVMGFLSFLGLATLFVSLLVTS